MGTTYLFPKKIKNLIKSINDLSQKMLSDKHVFPPFCEDFIFSKKKAIFM